MMNKSNTFLGYVALLSFFGITGFVFGALNGPLANTDAATLEASAARATLETRPTIDVALTGEAAYVMDVTTQEEVFSKNANAQLPLASVTKAALALLAYEHLRMDGVITFTNSDLLPEGESGFTVGESWQVRDLLDFTLMTSSNDGAAALSRVIERASGETIASLLNEKASELGLAQTYFINATGLDSNTALSGAYGSAQDIATLFAHIYTLAPDLLAATAVPEHTFTNLSGDTYAAINTNKALSELPGLVFGKTGFTDLAGGNLAVVTESEPGHPFVVVVLSSTPDERFIDVIELVRATLREPTN